MVGVEIGNKIDFDGLDAFEVGQETGRTQKKLSLYSYSLVYHAENYDLYIDL